MTLLHFNSEMGAALRDREKSQQKLLQNLKRYCLNNLDSIVAYFQCKHFVIEIRREDIK